MKSVSVTIPYKEFNDNSNKLRAKKKIIFATKLKPYLNRTKRRRMRRTAPY